MLKEKLHKAKKDKAEKINRGKNLVEIVFKDIQEYLLDDGYEVSVVKDDENRRGLSFPVDGKLVNIEIWYVEPDNDVGVGSVSLFDYLVDFIMTEL